MAGFEGERRLIRSSAEADLPPCCESWLAEQLLDEVERHRGDGDKAEPTARGLGESDRVGYAATRSATRLH